MKNYQPRIILGDCEKQLKKIEDNSIDLIITSPPYADRRSKTYGGIHPDKYVEWFLPISEQLLRILKPSGTFILNIKERVSNGERHTFVLENQASPMQCRLGPRQKTPTVRRGSIALPRLWLRNLHQEDWRAGSRRWL